MGESPPGARASRPHAAPCRRYRSSLRARVRGHVLSPPSRLGSYATQSMGLRPRLPAAAASPLHSNPGLAPGDDFPLDVNLCPESPGPSPPGLSLEPLAKFVAAPVMVSANAQPPRLDTTRFPYLRNFAKGSFVCFRQVSPPPCRADHSKKKLSIAIEDEPRINTKTDGPPLLRRRHGMKPTRERGRPARTFLGTASAISSTRLDRQRRQDPASTEPMPFPPAGWPGAASQGN